MSYYVFLAYSILISAIVILQSFFISFMANSLPIPMPPPVIKTCSPFKFFLGKKPQHLINTENPHINNPTNKA